MKTIIPVFSLTLLLSATLLFSVQPMFAKMILPLLGGTPQVWNTAMLFFQICLLTGYGYAHLSSKFLPTRAQIILHICLLGLFFIALPFLIPHEMYPNGDENPIVWQLKVMLLTVGGPFTIVSASAPLLQKWFSLSAHKDANNPYFLYGASNLGSMVSLLSYPFLIETYLTLSEQAYSWMIGYGTLIAAIGVCGAIIWTSAKNNSSAENNIRPTENLSWSKRGKWLLLSAIPSSLMLGVTTHITTNIASVPLIWVIPLALYLSTFIFVFAKKQIFSANLLAYLSVLFILGLLGETIIFDTSSPFILMGINFTTFFVVSMLCHKELADSKPSVVHLTEFYLIMSLGGVLGGLTNAIIAPIFFIIPIEYGLALSAALFFRFSNKDTSNDWKDLKQNLVILLVILVSGIACIYIRDNHNAQILCLALMIMSVLFIVNTRYIVAIALSAVILASPLSMNFSLLFTPDLLHQERNFFGILKVINGKNERLLMHGTTNHGTQPFTDDKLILEPVSYYSNKSPLRDVISLFENKADEQKFAVLGLGIGVTSCFTHKNRSYDFYEIDKAVADIAENKKYFTFMSDCGSPYQIHLGDGRLKIDEQPDATYDFILIDVFSSDNIPVHVITQEAVEIYTKKLKPDGTLVFHISNNFLDLEPVLYQISNNLGYVGYAKLALAEKIKKLNLTSFPAHYFVMTKNEDSIKKLVFLGWDKAQPRNGVHAWTDQYSNIFSVFGNKSTERRFNKAYAAKKEEKTAENNYNDETTEEESDK